MQSLVKTMQSFARNSSLVLTWFQASEANSCLASGLSGQVVKVRL